MRTQQQFLKDYAASHRNPANQVIHFICVPIIFFATGGLLWVIPIGRWLGAHPDIAYWLNGATLVGVFVMWFYLKMSVASALAMTVWLALSVAGFVAIQDAGWSLLWISAGLWIFGWLAQLWGHKLEGAKPSFADDILFLLVGPLFVMHELRQKFR